MRGMWEVICRCRSLEIRPKVRNGEGGCVMSERKPGVATKQEQEGVVK